MNVNLISPNENGNKYNIRFKEDIKIPAGSKIYMNYATLSRQSGFELRNDNVLRIVIPSNTTDLSKNLYPSRIPNTPATANVPFTTAEQQVGEATIPKGAYTYETLVVAIQVAIDSILSKAGNLADLSLYRSIRLTDIDNLYDDNDTQADVAFGIIKKNPHSLPPMAIEPMTETADLNAAHTLNFDFNGDGDAIKTSGNLNKPAPNAAVGVFDNYGVSALGLDFINYFGDTTPLKDMKGIEIKSNKTYQQIGADNDAQFFGVYSIPYAEGLYGTDGTDATNTDDRSRTGGNGQHNTRNGATFFNPKNTNYTDDNAGTITGNSSFSNPLLPVYGMIDGRGGTTRVMINTGVKARRTTPRDLFNQGETLTRNISSTNDYFTVGGVNGLEPTSTPHLKLMFIFSNLKISDADIESNNTAPYFFPVMVDMNRADPTLSFNQQPKEAKITGLLNGFNYHYLIDARGTVGAGERTKLTYDNENRIASQTPFNVVLGALKQNSGFSEIDYTPLRRAVGNGAKPLSIIRKYGMVADNELAQQIGIQKFTDFQNLLPQGQEVAMGRAFFPNTSGTEPSQSSFIKTTKFDLPWRKIGYSIKINNLPLQNFKNTDNNQNGGFSKNILANIPAPFRDAETDYNNTHDNIITSTYEPPFKVYSNIKNQDLVINNFDVEIVNNKTDKPATEILNSCINLSIETPSISLNKL